MPILVKKIYDLVKDTSHEASEWWPPENPFGAAYSSGPAGEDILDMVSARSIYRDLIRAKRNLPAEDIKVSIALDTGDPELLRAASVHRQAMRDLTKNPLIDEAESLEDLRTIWPADYLGDCPF